MIFVPYGMYACQDIEDLASSLHRSHEAIWRLMTVNALRQNVKLTKSSRDRFQSATDVLLRDWDIFQDDGSTDALRNKLTDLLFDAYQTWLKMLCFRNKVHTIYEWNADIFEVDRSDDSVKIPGDFGPSRRIEPVLRLSPAFLEETSSGQSDGLEVLRYGTTLFRASPALQAALSEEQELRSPKLGNKVPRQSQPER